MNTDTRQQALRELEENSGRHVLLPEARDFADVLEYIGEWTPTETANGEPRWILNNQVGPYCSIDLSQIGGKRFRPIAVRATDRVMAEVRSQIVTPDDTLSFKLIAHKHTGRVLVILTHSYVIGNHYLAYIDPETIPDGEDEDE